MQSGGCPGLQTRVRGDFDRPWCVRFAHTSANQKKRTAKTGNGFRGPFFIALKIFTGQKIRYKIFMVICARKGTKR